MVTEVWDKFPLECEPAGSVRSTRVISQADLNHVLEHTAELWPRLRGERTLLTGGTGFFGRWLIEAFLHANSRLGLGARLTVLSRKPHAFIARAPHLFADDALALIEGDIRSFAFPSGHFACVIHAATDAVVPSSSSAQEQHSVIVDGTRRVLEFATVAGSDRMLFTSSGAVYGQQPALVSHIGEEQPFAPSDSAYSLGKRAAEALCMQAGPRCSIARGFAFLGPHLPLDAHFAAGNFLRDALAGREIAITGDGTPLRSYLYAADLAIWLWTILLNGRAGRAYNVGSEEAVSIQGLAERLVAGVHPGLPVRVALPPSSPVAPLRYVPSTRRAQVELGLAAWIDLEESIRRTVAWHRNAPGLGVLPVDGGGTIPRSETNTPEAGESLAP